MLKRLGALFVALFLVVVTAGLVTALGDEPSAAAVIDPAAYVPPPVGPSRAAAPVQRGGLSALAEQRGDEVALHTASGDVTFWTGVNLGSTTPGHSPGELAVSREDYRRWFEQMGRLGVQVLRVYTIHGPQMYEELLAYNEAHRDAPLYLAQGVYLPDSTYVEKGDLFDAASTGAFDQELKDASDAVHGALDRPKAPGRATGTWTADVSPWLAAWIVGVEWEPRATQRSDARNAGVPEFAGKWFSSVPDGTPTSPTERWLAARMDGLAGQEAARGTSAPIAFVNWPTTDPLRHPEEGDTGEDIVGVDANHVRATAAWPGGTFASFHAYPYFPDFLRHDPGYASYEHGGRPDAYAGYLAALQTHFTVPLMITELGVPSSIGNSHTGTQGRGQGDHSEVEALATDAGLVRTVSELGLSGALVFAWSDEWFKFAWNTMRRQEVVLDGRRSLWHDPLTNEQFFGLVADDPQPVGRRVLQEAGTGVREVAVDHDASFVYLDVTLDEDPSAPVRLGFDVLPGGLALPGGGGGTASEVAVVVDPASRTATASIRQDLDPVQLDGLPTNAIPQAGPDGWVLQRMTLTRPTVVGGTLLPAEFQEVGRLREGGWDARKPGTDSRSTWQLDDSVLRLRLPWSMLALGDPSSRTAVQIIDGKAVPVEVPQIGVLVDAGPGGSAAAVLRWDGWNIASHQERLKPGIQPLVDAWSQLSRPAPPTTSRPS